MLQTCEANADTDVVSSDRFDGAHAERLNAAFAGLDPVRRIQLLRREIAGTLVFTTSFGLEDQALTHLIDAAGVDVRFVTLDTGRLFPETYDVWAATEIRYGIRVRGIQPDARAVEQLTSTHGINGFYGSKTAREACCAVRKLAPLGRGLQGAAGWITGLRGDQSAVRRGMRFVSQEFAPPVVKANPLFDWSRGQVAALVESAEVPSNPLHKRGYLSVGCAPCTRAVMAEEEERAGRWWWEDDDAPAECGLHVNADGHLVRARS